MPNVKVPTTITIDKMVPTSALRTGNGAPSRAPGSSVSRMPRDAVTGDGAVRENQANRPPEDTVASHPPVFPGAADFGHDGLRGDGCDQQHDDGNEAEDEHGDVGI